MKKFSERDYTATYDRSMNGYLIKFRDGSTASTVIRSTWFSGRKLEVTSTTISNDKNRKILDRAVRDINLSL